MAAIGVEVRGAPDGGQGCYTLQLNGGEQVGP